MKLRVVVALFLMGSVGTAVVAQVPAGGEFQVNTYTESSQGSPAVASDAGGSFVVAWQSYGQDGSLYGVFAQRYDASGALRGTEFRVNAYTTSGQSRPSVAAGATGNVVVAWRSFGQDGNDFGVFAQRFDASGAPRGAEFRVNSFTSNRQTEPAVASDAAGNFVVTWRSTGQGHQGTYSALAQRFDSSGSPQGCEFYSASPSGQGLQHAPTVAADASGNLVLVWGGGRDHSSSGIFARRFDALGNPRGKDFRVNTYTTDWQRYAFVASDAAGDFVVAWESYGQDGSDAGVFAQRYDASGTPRGGEFQVNTYTSGSQGGASVASDAVGNFVVAWTSDRQDGSAWGVFAQRYDASGAPRGAEFQVNTYATSDQAYPSVASDAAGNFVVTWQSFGQDGSYHGVFGQRFGGLQPAAISVDPNASAGSDGNGVLEPGETSVAVVPSWRNSNGAPQTFDGAALSFAGPVAGGVSYQLTDATGLYGTVPDGVTAACTDCYELGLTLGGTRPATHWDATFTERITPEALGQTKPWLLHIGESFSDVPKTSGYYRFVETMLHRGVTGGCTASTYCPTSSSMRGQMSIFTLVAKEGAGYLPPACGTTPMFADVPVASPFCRWVEEIARRGVVGGCGGGNFCPTSAVTRGQMPIFVLRTLDPTLDPPACGTTPMFSDVPQASPLCKWVEELARRGVVSGCGGGNYCPTNPVTREQMAVFVGAAFGLTLYGP